VLWGLVVAVALHPGYIWLSQKFQGRQKLAILLIVIVGIVIVLGPVSLILNAGIESLQTFADQLEKGIFIVPPPPSGVKGWPVLGKFVFQLWDEANRNLAAVIDTYRPQLNTIATKIIAFAGTTGLGIIQFVVSIIIAGIFMLNAPVINHGLLRLVLRLSPLKGPGFMMLAVATIRSVARGIIGVAVFQTILLSLGLFLAHIPLAALLSVGCFILSLVQIGPGIIVLGTIIYAWTHFSVVSAVVFTLWMVVAGFSDNVLKPIVMSQGLSVPMLVTFLGVIGGTLSHGLLGLFIGPVVLSLGYEILQAWVDQTPDPTAATD
jgi:predicted PurR-regulated permease PerM